MKRSQGIIEEAEQAAERVKRIVDKLVEAVRLLSPHADVIAEEAHRRRAAENRKVVAR